MHHAIIVGARVAGSPLAMLLARKGYKVMVVDRALFPSDTVSTHLIWHSGMALLQDWGLIDRVRAINAPAITEIQLDLGPIHLRGPAVPAANGVAEARGTRRYALDKVLVDAAAEAGADVREGFAVEDLLWEGDRVVGIRGRTGTGFIVEERAQIVIGADGRTSRVAKWVDAPTVIETRDCVASCYSYFSGVEMTAFEEFGGDDFGMGAIPTNDGLVCAVAGWTKEFKERHGGKYEQAYWAAIRQNESLYDRLKGGKREAPLRFMGEAPGFLKWSHGSGWALAGDAGYYRHPVTAQGISDAFRDAERLARALDDAFSGRVGIEDALARREREREQAVMPIFESTTAKATFTPPPPFFMPLLEALQYLPRERAQFFGTEAGTYPMEKFYDPDNIERILNATGVFSFN